MTTHRATGPGIDLEYDKDDGLLSGYIDLNFFKSGMPIHEWRKILGALKLLTKYSDTPGELDVK